LKSLFSYLAMTSFVDDGKGAMAQHILGAVFIFPDNIHCMRKRRRMRRLEVLLSPTLPLSLSQSYTPSRSTLSFARARTLALPFYFLRSSALLLLPIAIVENGKSISFPFGQPLNVILWPSTISEIFT